MKKNKILLMASVACTFMFTSCSDLLDLYPEDSLSDPKFWRKAPVPMTNRTVT